MAARKKSKNMTEEKVRQIIQKEREEKSNKFWLLTILTIIDICVVLFIGFGLWSLPEEFSIAGFLAAFGGVILIMGSILVNIYIIPKIKSGDFED